jgi:hypothetical protein
LANRARASQLRELEFLRALTLNDPILCVLLEPEGSQATNWLQATWEGLVGWAYRSGQRFVWRGDLRFDPCRIQVGTAGLIHTYLRPTVLKEESPRLFDTPGSLNLITIKREADLPNDFDRFTALWPGHVFEFRPEYDPNGQPTLDMKAINDCLYMVSGNAPEHGFRDSPLRVLNWARKAYNQVMTRPQVLWGDVISSKEIQTFKGSNECPTTLALKAHIAAWACKRDKNAEFRFEVNSYDFQVESEEERILQRFDLYVDGLGRFEIESMNGSGPMETFYQRKIFSRIRGTPGKPFWLVVPSEAVLWAGPFLADLAFRTGEHGRVVMPSADGQLLMIEGRQLTAPSVEMFDPTPISKSEALDSELTQAAITLNDLAGYRGVRRQIEDLIIWSERHRTLLQGTSKSSGILLFGPPGCGKSRWARAIAGELKQEARLLAPSDLRGPYLGWGQVMIREQFDWLADNNTRMLIFDELDAVARSRRKTYQMHSDDMASVNELLVQIDRVLGLGRLIVGTTNFIGSLDEALTRSGRFGRYIPIGPPDFEESVGIIVYYLGKLTAQCGQGSRIKISVPDRPDVGRILKSVFDEKSTTQNRFCGADLEEAVNRAYLRCARRVVPDGGWDHESEALAVCLSTEELGQVLNEVPMSVTENMMRRFMRDMTKYCGRQATESYSALHSLQVP